MAKSSKPRAGKLTGAARPGGAQGVGRVPADKAGKVARPGGPQSATR